MQFIIAALWGALATALSSLVGRALLALSMGYVTYKGFSASLDWVKALLQSNFAFTGKIGALLGFLYVDKAVSIVFSAFTVALGIKTSTGAITKLVIKK